MYRPFISVHIHKQGLALLRLNFGPVRCLFDGYTTCNTTICGLVGETSQKRHICDNIVAGDIKLRDKGGT
jgi:hypothetical protein